MEQEIRKTKKLELKLWITKGIKTLKGQFIQRRYHRNQQTTENQEI